LDIDPESSSQVKLRNQSGFGFIADVQNAEAVQEGHIETAAPNLGVESPGPEPAAHILKLIVR
jgi:hypothetical protein